MFAKVGGNEIMSEYNNTIPIFFAVDDGYIPFLAVSIQSLVDNCSSDNFYLIKILYTNIREENQKKIAKYERENVSIEFVDLNYYIDEIKDKLYTRDYYTKTTYFRLFIPNLYPQYNKALYLDSDIVILTDIAKLYATDMGDNLVAAVPDDVIQTFEVFQEYVEKVVGVASYKNYFNAGILLMNLDELRKFGFQEKFLYSLEKIKFSVAQDQDYLNRLCKGRVKIVDGSWNRMPIATEKASDSHINLIHYNLAYKPWHFEDILYKEYFWEYARKTEFFHTIMQIKENFTEEDKFRDLESDRKLKELAKKESSCVGDDRSFRNAQTTISRDRLMVLEKIKKLEREGKFDVDPEEDPPTIVLTPENVDYLSKKCTSKIKNIFAYKCGELFFKEIVKSSKLIIKDVIGIENLNEIKTGAIITCNHFNPFDCFTVESVFRNSALYKNNKKLYKVIREGNYTNFPGFYGFLFRNCNTLPLSSNKRTMIDFMKAIREILERGDCILMYPEQSLWWNYRKPKPFKDGAFKLACKNNVPIVPIFITMTDSDILGDDGYPVQEYTVHIGEPITPRKDLDEKENAAWLRDENFAYCRKVYEAFYKRKLEYTTESGGQSDKKGEERKEDNLF